MAMNTNNIKDFERIQSTIQKTRSEWEKGTIKPDKTDTYTGIWESMNNYRFFIQNEHKDSYAEFDRLGSLYNPAVVAREKSRFDDEFGKLTAVATATFRKMITDFTESRHKKVTTMLRTAPTESMKNLLETLKMRDDLDAVELYDIMPLFYENYHAMRALQAISRQNGITLIAPVQMDASTMHQTIDRAAEYLLGACDEMFKPKSKTTHYNDFFTVNEADKGKIYSPVYADIVTVLDTVPQLQDFKAAKTALTPLEKTRVDWYYRDVPENANKTQLAQHTRDIMAKHPEDVALLKLSQYAEYVEIVEAAQDAE